LKLLHVNDATRDIEQIAETIEPQDTAAAREYRARRPSLNFLEMGIPIGSELLFSRGDARALVTADKRVSVNGVDSSLTAATRTLLGLDYDVNPTSHWIYNGRNLRDIYDETYQREAETQVPRNHCRNHGVEGPMWSRVGIAECKPCAFS
jgi:hypothetical protein